MLWANLAPLLKSTITACALRATDPLYSAAFTAEYKDQAKQLVNAMTQASIDLRITSTTDTLTGERWTFDPAANAGVGDLSSAMHGMRDFTLNVQCKSYDLTYAAWAHEYAERIRTRMHSRAVRDALLAGGDVTLVNAGKVQSVDGKEDGEAVSVASLDLFMRAGFVDAPLGGLNWIQTIILTSHVKKPDGTEYPVPPNVTNVALP